MNRVFGDGVSSIHARFPGLQGVLLQDAIWKAYAIEKNTTIQYLKPDKSPNVLRHRLNDRSQGSTTEFLAQSVEQQGALIGVRGNAWAVKNDDSYHMLTWGHLCEGVLAAAARSPENPYVVATLNRGIVNVTIFNASTPDDVLHYLIRMHNTFHHGSGTSFLDVMSDLKTIEAKWVAHRNREHISSRGAVAKSQNQNNSTEF